jgi:hypothetical protein
MIKVQSNVNARFGWLKKQLDALAARITSLSSQPRVLGVTRFTNLGLAGTVAVPNPGSAQNLGNIDIPISSWPAGATFAVIEFGVNHSFAFNRTAAGDAFYADHYMTINSALPIGGGGGTATATVLPSANQIAPNNGNVTLSGPTVYGKIICSGATNAGVRVSVMCAGIGSVTNLSTKNLTIYRLNGTITFYSGAIPS